MSTTQTLDACHDGIWSFRAYDDYDTDFY